MAQLKVNYGIDLGTTNSVIARMEAGKPTVKKIEVTDDIMPSCVYFQKNKKNQDGIGSCRVGKQAYSNMKSDKRRSMKKMDAEASNTYLEFKRTMGTDKRYTSSNMGGREYSSEELSAEVLKALKSFITDEDFKSVIITVPAKFTVNQKTATIKAAKLAGFNHVELLQEPIAAAMAYGLTSSQKDGYWLVFDFGGGTFDAALIKVEDGIIQVFDTEGDNYLGGKNLDYAIVDNILIPYLQDNYSIDRTLSNPTKKEIIRDAMKTFAEDIKNELSFKDSSDLYVDPGDLGEDEDGEEIEIDLAITKDEVYNVFRPLFQKAVDICKDLLKRNNLTSQQLGKLILVGGPTHSPLVREMLKEQVSPNVDSSINPMTAVAEGAALYASTIDNEIKEEDLQSQDVVLEINFDSMTVDTDIWVPVSLKSGADSVMVQFVRSDNAWDSGKTEVDHNGNVVELHLVEGQPNSFRVECSDHQGNRLNCFPNEITIIQGSKVGNATLPYDISIAIYNEQKDRDVVAHVAGLERNKTVPAIGVRNDLHTNVQVRAGVDTDILRIPIYQADQGSEGKSAIFYEFVGEVEINGDDVDVTIPKNANVDVTVKVDRNEQMTVEAYFPDQDVTVEKTIDTSKEQSLEDAREFADRELPKAKKAVRNLSSEGHDVADLERQLESVEQEHANSTESKMVMQHLKEVLRKIEDFEEGTEWGRVEAELRDEFDRLEKANADLGNNKTNQAVEALRAQIDEVIRKQDVKMARELKEIVNHLFFQLTMVYQCRYLIEDMNRDFNSIQWKDRNRARTLINQGMAEINNQPTREKLQPIAVALLELLPEEEKARRGSGLS
ncbi:MAG: Hsp70 family protein [Muribaculaceae bacterium]|nr:Hsp70 family protein [Muribaculaceae bacterium]